LNASSRSDASVRLTGPYRPTVALVSSGTGGHLWPAIVLADAFRDAGCRTLLVTEGRRVEREFLDRVDVERAGTERLELPVPGHGLRRLLGLPRAVGRARRRLTEAGVDAVVGTGGAVAFVCGLAAATLRVPSFTLEMNARIGRANRLLLPFTDRLFTALPRPTPGGRVVHTGAPVRSGFGVMARASARAALGFDDARPLVLVTGGSQGAEVLNRVVPEALTLVSTPLQVLHLCGPGHEQETRARYARIGGVSRVVVEPLSVAMDTCFAAADLVIGRGGGGTVSELMAAGRAAVVVPYPHHRDEQQKHNGRILVEAGAAAMIEQRDLDAPGLARVVRGLVTDRRSLARMERAAHALAPAGATGRIVDLVLGRLGCERIAPPEPMAAADREVAV
jgi:UDP-N-acetylglucosamine--N-acetylmuramyl-(pentapeptide) pyrophosphoryl-undecaprenol N-acetylglucosamine transferase